MMIFFVYRKAKLLNPACERQQALAGLGLRERRQEQVVELARGVPRGFQGLERRAPGGARVRARGRRGLHDLDGRAKRLQHQLGPFEQHQAVAGRGPFLQAPQSLDERVGAAANRLHARAGRNGIIRPSERAGAARGSRSAGRILLRNLAGRAPARGL